jgi:hypothetical protein
MQHSLTDSTPRTSNTQLLLAYVADLELEVDRLRKQAQFVRHEVGATLRRVQLLCADAPAAGDPLPPLPPLAEIGQAVTQLGAVLRDLRESPGYHPPLRSSCACLKAYSGV